MRYTPLKKKGKHGEAMDVIRRKVWPKVLARHPVRACEGCGAPDRTLEWAHVFGRRGTGGGLGAWADLADLTSKLCVGQYRLGEVGCHDKLDRHLDDVLAFRLTWAAIHRLAQTCHVDLGLLGLAPLNCSPVDAIRHLVRVLEDAGWAVDPETVSPVRA